MTVSNVARLQEAYQAYVERKDLSVFGDMLVPDVEWIAFDGENACRNRDEVLATVQDAIAQGTGVGLPEFIGGGDTFVMIPRLDRLPPFFPDDAEGLFQVVEMQNGKILRMRDFAKRSQALSAAGLPAQPD